MISSQAREILTGVEAVIVDEIHAVAPSKRGSHLALTLERLEHLAEKTVQRIGLSATQRPLERIGQFLVGRGRKCEIVDASKPKKLDLEIVVPVEDMTEPDADREAPGRRRLRALSRVPDADRPGGDAGAGEALDLAGDLPEAAASWSRSTPRRSSSSTTAARPSGSPSA